MFILNTAKFAVLRYSPLFFVPTLHRYLLNTYFVTEAKQALLVLFMLDIAISSKIFTCSLELIMKKPHVAWIKSWSLPFGGQR